MIGSLNSIVSFFLGKDFPTRQNAFLVQKNLLERLLYDYNDSPLYKNLALTQDKRVVFENQQEMKSFLAAYPLCTYADNILPLLQSGSGIVMDQYELQIKTSGTSDANKGYKLIPAQRSSFSNERLGISRTLSYYLQENKNSKILYRPSFALSAPFDYQDNVGYVSGSMRASSLLSSWMMYPSQKILSINNRNDKKSAIVNELLSKQPALTSMHGVPTWPLDIIDTLIQHSSDLTKKILQSLEYISIGGGPALDYKYQFQKRMFDLGLMNRIAGSNNHNASEGFLGSQIRNFFDLEYHQMSPMMQTNFFVFVPVDLFDQFRQGSLLYADMIMQSHLLNEVVCGIEYLMMFANDRIPWLYNIKDKVIFQKNDNLPDSDSVLEYIVTGRYGMASNVFNEHIELEHLYYVFDVLIERGYSINKNSFVAGMQLIDNQGIFHIVLETNAFLGKSDLFVCDIDNLLASVNDQWKLFRLRGKIQKIELSIFPYGSIRSKLIALGKMHEQSKIPHLSDKNFEEIIKPLLSMSIL